MQAEAGKIGPDGFYVTGVLRGRAPTYPSTFKDCYYTIYIFYLSFIVLHK